MEVRVIVSGKEKHLAGAFLVRHPADGAKAAAAAGRLLCWKSRGIKEIQRGLNFERSQGAPGILTRRWQRRLACLTGMAGNVCLVDRGVSLFSAGIQCGP